MKVKYWEMTKEDLERFASRVMDHTIKTLVVEDYMHIDDGKDFAAHYTPIAITPDSVNEDLKEKMFPKENLNEHCLIRLVRIR